MKPDLTNIKNIVFDLGKVLLNLDFNASVNAFKELGMSTEVITPLQAYADPVFYEFEVGRTTPGAFRRRIRQILNNPDATDKQIDDAWCAMLLDIPDHRVELIKTLGKKFGLYLFSNTNAIHITRMHRKFREAYGIEFPSLFTKIFYSHEIHERKPDISAYMKVMEMSGINPVQSLFIDDLEKNVEGASRAGMSSCWLKNGMEVTDLF
jgi:glucose-1-phosphatase